MNNGKNTSVAFSAVSWIGLLGGVIVYMIGLWKSDMQLNEKGYYIAVIALALFSSISLQKTIRDKMENIPTTPIYYGACVGSFVISIILLCVGLWNAELLLSEKGFYGIAFFLSLFGAVAVQKNTRDSVDNFSSPLPFKKPDDEDYAEKSDN